jgi:hypothetical protein
MMGYFSLKKTTLWFKVAGTESQTEGLAVTAGRHGSHPSLWWHLQCYNSKSRNRVRNMKLIHDYIYVEMLAGIGSPHRCCGFAPSASPWFVMLGAVAIDASASHWFMLAVALPPGESHWGKEADMFASKLGGPAMAAEQSTIRVGPPLPPVVDEALRHDDAPEVVERRSKRPLASQSQHPIVALRCGRRKKSDTPAMGREEGRLLVMGEGKKTPVVMERFGGRGRKAIVYVVGLASCIS